MRERREREGGNGATRAIQNVRLGKGNQGRLKVLELDRVSNFFFSNFLEGSKNSELWQIFAHYERVGEVFIPSKVDKWGKKFGFVKFLEVNDVEELEGRLQDVWVGEMRLKVNIARFGREFNLIYSRI